MRFILKVSLILSLLFLIANEITAQSPSRSGFPADKESKNAFRRFPCGGITVLDEKFEEGNTLPAGWLSIDADGLAPKTEIRFLTPSQGWQSIIDFKDPDSMNHAWASPSWYEDTAGTSNDFLITPKVLLPANTCLSWYAYSQDKFFPESYEIRVSTTTPDEAGFLQNEAVEIINQEGDEFTYRSISLNDYAGQEVYIAFRHTSKDKFILVLDDIRLAQVENTDIAMFNVDRIKSLTLDTLTIKGAVINRGLTSMDFDSAQMKISYQINDEEIKTIGLGRAFTLLPNDTVRFAHDSLWAPPSFATYRLRVWVGGFGTDDQVENDTIGRFQSIGLTTALEPEKKNKLEIYPNPARHSIKLNLSTHTFRQADIYLTDIQGRMLWKARKDSSYPDSLEIPIGHLTPGLYFLQLKDAAGKIYTGKFLKE